MQQPIYDAAVAKSLLEVAFSGWEPHPYIVREDGVYQSAEHVAVSPAMQVFDWAPAYEMDWPGAPNPMTAAMLPIPFSAAQLAAFMLDGAGAMLPEELGCCIGYPLDESALNERFNHPRWRVVREALEGAFSLAAQAQKIVGEFDYAGKARAHEFMLQLDDADGEANEREGVFEVGVTPEEANTRRARAIESVAMLREQAQQAKNAAEIDWHAWRKAMVSQLLQGPQAAAPVVKAATPQQPEWKERARERAVGIIKRQRDKDLYPSQIDIADEIAREFRNSQIHGTDGKPLSGEYIKRHALKGISSAVGKSQATAIRRGK